MPDAATNQFLSLFNREALGCNGAYSYYYSKFLSTDSAGFGEQPHEVKYPYKAVRESCKASQNDVFHAGAKVCGHRNITNYIISNN